MTDDVVVSISDTFDMTRSIDEIVLVVTNLVFVVAAGIVVVFISRARHAAERQQQIQAWHLRQLLPSAKR